MLAIPSAAKAKVAAAAAAAKAITMGKVARGGAKVVKVWVVEAIAPVATPRVGSTHGTIHATPPICTSRPAVSFLCDGQGVVCGQWAGQRAIDVAARVALTRGINLRGAPACTSKPPATLAAAKVTPAAGRNQADSGCPGPAQGTRSSKDPRTQEDQVLIGTSFCRQRQPR
jgi:hypothetical protein